MNLTGETKFKVNGKTITYNLRGSEIRIFEDYKMIAHHKKLGIRKSSSSYGMRALSDGIYCLFMSTYVFIFDTKRNTVFKCGTIFHAGVTDVTWHDGEVHFHYHSRGKMCVSRGIRKCAKSRVITGKRDVTLVQETEV